MIGVLLIGAAVLLQSPRIQTRITQRVMAVLQEKMDAEIRIEKLHLRPFNALVIKNIEIIDQHPLQPGLDTFFRADYVTATFSLGSLLEGKGVRMGRAYVRNGMMTLTVESKDDSSSITNIERILRTEFTGGPSIPNETQYFEIDHVDVEGFRYRMVIEDLDLGYPDDAIDWGDLDVYDIHVKGRKLGMKGIVMYGIADEVSFKEKSGYVVHHLSGKTRVGEGRTIVQDMRLRDTWSDINLAEFRMTYTGTDAFKDYISKVQMDADILPSRVSMRTIRYFAPQISFMTAVANVTGGFHGYVNDFRLDRVRVKTLDSGLSATVDGRMTGIPDAMALDAQLSNARFTARQLGDFLTSISPATLDFSRLAPGQTFRFDGTVKGPLEKLTVQGTAQAPEGRADAHLLLSNIHTDRDIALSGQLSTHRLGIGRILGIDALDELSMHSGVALRLADRGPELQLDSLRISALDALGYRFTGISANAKYGADGISGSVYCDDPNLLFTLDGRKSDNVFKVTGDIGYADLNEIGLDKRGISRLSLAVDGGFTQSGENGLQGSVGLLDIVLEDAQGLHEVGDAAIDLHKNGTDNRIALTSRFAEGSFSGSAFIDEFVSDLKHLTLQQELPALTGLETGPYSGHQYQLALTTHDTKDLLSFVLPGLYVAGRSSLQMDIGADASLRGSLVSQRLAYLDKYLKDVRLDINNRDSGLSGDLSVGEISIGGIILSDNNLTAYANDNHLGLGYSYENEGERINKGELYLSGELRRPERDSLEVYGQVLPSNLYLNSDAWSIGSGPISWTGERLHVDSLQLRNASQSLLADGGWSRTKADSLQVRLQDFNLAMLNNILSQNLDIQGLATGHAQLTSPTGERLGLQLGIRVDSTRVAGQDLGQVRVRSLWDEEQQGFGLNLSNDWEGRSNIRAEGLYVPGENHLQLLANLDGFNAGVAQPMLASVFSELSGHLSGAIRLNGPLNNLDIYSNGLQIDDGALRVDYTNVLYQARGPLHLDNDGCWFDGVEISDKDGSQGRVEGSIRWDHFRDMQFDIHIPFRQMQVLNLPEGGNDMFYGTAYGTGRVDITGPMSLITLSVDAATAKEGSFHLPLSRADAAGSSNLLTFTQADTREWVDPYEEIQRMFAKEESSGVSLLIKLRLHVNRDTEALIEVNKETGNVLSGRGEGDLDIDIQPSKDIFTLNGNYNIVSGKYHLDVMSIAQKDFLIEDGSSIKFNGNVMDSELDINALYKLKASIGTLIADSTSTARRNVECGLHITDRLSGPRIQFSIDVPDLDPATQVRVSEALSSEDKVQKQFLSLLIAGSFLPDESSGIVNNSSMLNTTVSEIMAGQLNNIMQKLDLPIDFGLDYQTSASGRSVYDVAVSTQLFNNRVIVNGTIGNRQYGSTSTNTSEVVGDLDIEIKLDKSGALRLNLFSHSADQYSSYLDNSQRNGVGLTYQQEFSNFKDLWRRMFGSRRRRTEAEFLRNRALRNEEKVQIHIEKDD